MNILVLNGPNLNLLGQREPGIYGDRNYAALVAMIEEKAKSENKECMIMQTSGSSGNPLVVQRLRLCASNTGIASSVPGQGRSHMPGGAAKKIFKRST